VHTSIGIATVTWSRRTKRGCHFEGACRKTVMRRCVHHNHYSPCRQRLPLLVQQSIVEHSYPVRSCACYHLFSGRHRWRWLLYQLSRHREAHENATITQAQEQYRDLFTARPNMIYSQLVSLLQARPGLNMSWHPWWHRLILLFDACVDNTPMILYYHLLK
jgi:hypothetical protein